MVARKAEVVYREVLHAAGKLDGKAHKWIVSVFANEARLRSHHALLNMAYKGGDAETIKKLDPNSPASRTGGTVTEVKFSKETVPYNLEASGPDEAAAL